MASGAPRAASKGPTQLSFHFRTRRFEDFFEALRLLRLHGLPDRHVQVVQHGLHTWQPFGTPRPLALRQAAAMSGRTARRRPLHRLAIGRELLQVEACQEAPRHSVFGLWEASHCNFVQGSLRKRWL